MKLFFYCFKRCLRLGYAFDCCFNGAEACFVVVEYRGDKFVVQNFDTASVKRRFCVCTDYRRIDFFYAEQKVEKCRAVADDFVCRRVRKIISACFVQVKQRLYSARGAGYFIRAADERVCISACCKQFFCAGKVISHSRFSARETAQE